MNVVGIDGSTFHLDLVKLDIDSDRAEWTRHSLEGGGLAWDRIQRARELPLGGTYWDDVALVGIEQPAGKGDSPLLISFVLGLVLAHIPERIPVFRLMPAEWRKACGLPGNCSKDTVYLFAHDKREPFEPPIYDAWPQDACDAYAIAYAARAINESAASVAEGNQTQEEAA